MRRASCVVAGAALLVLGGPCPGAGLVAGGVEVVPPPSVPAKAPTPLANRWEGVEKRTPGLVLFGKRWFRGLLSVKDGTVSWSDGADGRRNILVPTGAVASQELSCPSPGAPCTWTLRTRRTEHVFRDGTPVTGGVLGAFVALREARPDLPSGRRPEGK